MLVLNGDHGCLVWNLDHDCILLSCSLAALIETGVASEAL